MRKPNGEAKKPSPIHKSSTHPLIQIDAKNKLEESPTSPKSSSSVGSYLTRDTPTDFHISLKNTNKSIDEAASPWLKKFFELARQCIESCNEKNIQETIKAIKSVSRS
jgi:hypothetical protein